MVELEQKNERLVIHGIDEGQGFDMKEIVERKNHNGGFGLFSVQERLRLVGGHMEVRSQLGIGTHVVIRAPVRAVAKVK